MVGNKIIHESTVTGNRNERTDLCKQRISVHCPHEKWSLKQAGRAINIIKEYDSAGCCSRLLTLNNSEWRCPPCRQMFTLDLTRPRPSRQGLFCCFSTIVVINCSHIWKETKVLLNLTYFSPQLPALLVINSLFFSFFSIIFR